MRWRRPLLIVSIFLSVAGARSWLLREYGNPVPVWDQWDGEAASVLVPLLHGNLRAADFFKPHNEHRIAMTRATAFLLFLANGQWDPSVEMLVGALLWAGTAAFLAWVTFAWPGAPDALVAIVVVAAFALPFGWGNFLGGFQSAFYYLIVTSVVGIWGVTRGRPFTKGWWVGLVCLFLALWTVGSGVLGAAAAFGIVAGRGALRRDRRLLMADLPTLLACATCFALGWWLKATPPLTFRWPQPETPGAFVLAFLRNLAWPAPELFGLAFVLWLPFAAFAWTLLRKPSSEDGNAWFLLAAGCWVVLQAASMALYRAGYGSPASRYQDILVVGVLCNLAALFVLRRRAPGRALLAVASVWGLIAAVGIGKVTLANFGKELPERRRVERIQEVDLREFVITGDTRVFDGKEVLPYPYPERLASLLRDPALKNILPPDVRIPERIEADESSGFAVNALGPGAAPERIRPAWGSYLGSGAANVGTFRSGFFAAPGTPFLRFEVSGDLGAPDTSLVVVTEDGDVRRVRPTGEASDGWRVADVRVPERGLLRIIALDQSASAWFAFRAPTATGVLSHFALQSWAGGAAYFALGLVGVAVALAARRLATGRRTLEEAQRAQEIAVGSPPLR